jgi:dTDP-4-dehydrorhamnose reductase
MKLLIIGGNGTIGKKVSAHFSKTHEIIVAGRTSGDVTVDIAEMQFYVLQERRNGRLLIR